MEDNLSNQSEPQINLDSQSIKYLEVIQKWTFFFAILGFIAIFLLLLTGILSSSIISLIGEQMEVPISYSFLVFSFPLIISCIIYFFPVFYLYKFSKFAKKAIMTNDSNLIREAFRYFKNYFQFIGIVAVIALSITLVACIGFILGLIFLA
jgi:hypothetical protein